MSAWSPFPNSLQGLLLKAALTGREEALPAWKKWRSTVDFELDVDRGSFRLLPLIYKNLSSFDYSDDLMTGRLKGIYRQEWIKNQQLFYKTGKIVQILNDNEIPAVVLKGIALTKLVYKNCGIRPMGDMDILVPLSERDHAIEILKNKGFDFKHPHLVEHSLEFGHGISLVNADNTEVDLHWHFTGYSHGNIKEKELWDKVIPIEVGGVQTNSLSHTDNLLHTIIHGIRRNHEPPIRWIADAISIINSPEISVDWHRLLSFASKLRVSLQLKKSLLYLKDHFDAEIPREIIDWINGYEPTYVERVVFKHGEKIGDADIETTIVDRAYSMYARYLRHTSREGLFSIHLGLVGYVAHRIKARLT